MTYFCKIPHLVVAGVICIALALSPSRDTMAASGDTMITTGTGSIVGVYYRIGGVICRFVNKDREKHGLECTVEPTGASVYNATAIRSGDLAMGLIQSDIQYDAYKGVNTFANAGPDTEMRVLFGLYLESFTVVARDDARIRGFDDLKGKRLGIGYPGAANRNTLETVLREYGWSYKAFAATPDVDMAKIIATLCDNRIDAYFYMTGHPNSLTRRAVATCNVHVVPIQGPKFDRFVKSHPFYHMNTIPGGTYESNPEPIPTFGVRASLVTSTRMTDDQAYIITKSIFENLDEFKKAHPALADLDPKEMIEGNTAPLHPGAVRYYKEKGLMP